MEVKLTKDIKACTGSLQLSIAKLGLVVTYHTLAGYNGKFPIHLFDWPFSSDLMSQFLGMFY